jgi:hypothetical protein
MTVIRTCRASKKRSPARPADGAVGAPQDPLFEPRVSDRSGGESNEPGFSHL